MIRKYNINDISTIVDLELKTIHTTLGNDYFINELNNSMFYTYVYVIDEMIVGYISTMFDGSILEILNICVYEEYQNKGIGKELLNYVFNNISNIDSAILEVRSSNSKAIHVYNKLGFIQIHIRKNYYSNNEDALILRRCFDGKN